VAQLSGTLDNDRVYGAWYTEITDFAVDELSGFTHQNGRLIVRSSGYYYIYAQAWIEKHTGNHRNRVAIAVNGNPVSLLQTSRESDYGAVFSGATKYLYRGDYISLKTVYPSKLWMAKAQTFFGAYEI